MTNYPLAGETLITTPFRYDERAFLKDLEGNPQWKGLSFQQQDDLTDDVLMELTCDFKNLHVGSRVSSRHGFFKRQDGSMGLLDIVIIKLNKDRVALDNPNEAFYPWNSSELHPAPPLSFGTFKDVTSETHCGFYGCRNTLDGGLNPGMIQDTEPLFFFYNREGEVGEMTMRAIASRSIEQGSFLKERTHTPQGLTK